MPELTGILNWMLQGLKEYREKGLEPSEEIKAATNSYRSEMDVMEQWLQENCLRHPAGNKSIDNLHKDYITYVANECSNDEGALKKRKFADALTARGFEAGRGSGGTRLRKGLMLRNPDRVSL